MKLYYRLMLFILSALLLPADQLLLKNGDRLTGSIVKFEGKDLVIKTEFAGTVTVQWDAITDVKTDAPIYVGLQDGQTVVGTVTTSDGTLTIETRETGTVTAARASVKSIRDKAEQTAHETQVERYRNPRLTDLWAGFVDLGFAQSTGNAIVSTINTSANATRATNRDKTTANFTSIYSRNKTGGLNTLTANLMRGGIAYNFNVSKHLFVYASTDLEFDEFQKLDLRFVPAVGFGHHAIQNKNTVLDIFGGGALNKEFYSTGLRRSSAEASFGDDLSHKLFGGLTVLRQKLVFYPNLSETGEYRLNFDLSTATTLKKWLSWQISFSNRYISNPLPGRKTNDLLITTGFRITFAK